MDIALWLSITTVIFLGAFASRMQATTLWAGKKIAPEGMDADMPRGFQDAITPKIQDTFNTILPICYLVILVSGSIKSWYLGVVLLLVAFIGMFIAKTLISNKIKFYLKIINYYMANKTADYAKTGDVMRTEAAKDVSEKLQQLYFDIKDDLLVPDLSEVKKRPLGK